MINFINEKNEADKRVFELLSEKFNLFQGVFGASDEILGSIESGVDFEKRIVQIYQKCRKSEEIKQAFDELQLELEKQINENMNSAKQKLLDHFDEEVHEKLKMNLMKSSEYLNKFENWLLKITKHYLGKNFIELSDNKFRILEESQGFYHGNYKIGKIEDNYRNYRLNYPFAQKIINTYLGKEVFSAEILFDLSGYEKIISCLEPLKGKSGEMQVSLLSVENVTSQDYILYSAIDNDGKVLDNEQCERMFYLSGEILEERVEIVNKQKLEKIHKNQVTNILEEVEEKNGMYFSEEYEKLDKWAEDRRQSICSVLREYDEQLKEVKKNMRLIRNNQERFELIKKQRNIQNKKYEKEKELEKEMQIIDIRFNELLDEIQKQLNSKYDEKIIFAIKWSIQ